MANSIICKNLRGIYKDKLTEFLHRSENWHNMLKSNLEKGNLF